MAARPHIKIRLPATDEGHHAAQVIEYWKSRREMSKHLPRAIALYYGLASGDLTLLYKYFPQIAAQLGAQTAPNGSGGRLTPARHYSAAERPTITTQEKSADDDIGDLLDSLGI